ncbi:hypothetical protein BU17DRAFT_51623 [Hysterangium stoloniferum]|nr:hypothetical protein BU17DRAFT_51623 [Hysterangium stoloniferum]
MRGKAADALSLVEPPKHHEIYYTEGVVILVSQARSAVYVHVHICRFPQNKVERTLFRVPRTMIERNAPELAHILPSNGEEKRGTEDVPVYLEDITAKDFERLLTVIYPMQRFSRISVDDYPSASWTSEEWASILHLATKWSMKGLRAMAIKNLNTVASPAVKIRLGRKYGHPTWVSEGFMTLCLHTEPLTVKDGEELEMKDVIECASVREVIRAKIFTLEAGTTMFSSTRLGNVRVRIGKYEDGMKYANSKPSILVRYFIIVHSVLVPS